MRSGIRTASLTISISALLVLLTAACGAAAQGNGVPVDGYPAWRDRAMTTAINACRMAPAQFRDNFLQYPGILQPQNHPSTHPLQWCGELNHAARFHSEDMVSCNTLQHISCDGTSMTTRVYGYYPYAAMIGECVAAGIPLDPFEAVVMWLEDGGEPDGMTAGHRANIMNSVFTEGGAGHCYSPITTFRDYYTFDFGGRELDDPPPLVDGAHLFIMGGTTSFWANYYAPGGAAPLTAKVYVEGVPWEMTQLMGATDTGTWTADIATADSCRSYVFQMVDSAGQTHWYPQAGSLRTWGEGGCTEDYLAGPTDAPPAAPPAAVLEPPAPNPLNPGTTIRFRTSEPGNLRLTVVDLRGRLVRTLLVDDRPPGEYAVRWDGRDESGRPAAAGIYCVRLQAGYGAVQVRKLSVVK